MRHEIFNHFINSELRESPLGRKLQHLRLLTNLGTMKQTGFRRLLPKEFDAALLEKLTREGRVYIAVPRVTDKDAYKREILDYVRTIDDFATDMWREEISGLWQTLVEKECFHEDLIMKKGPEAGHFNRYAVTNIVCMMQNKGIYRSDVSMLALHLRLEHTTQRNKYYKSSGNYVLNPEARFLLKLLLRRESNNELI